MNARLLHNIRQVPAEQVVEIRELGGEDVDSLIDCIRRCYRESYTEPDFYDPSNLRAVLHSRRLLSIGAVVERRVVGPIGTRLPVAGDPVADTIGGIVDPDHRGRGLTVRMGSRMVDCYRERGIVATRHVATGAHDRTQRLIVAAGGVATGVLLGHVPAGTDYRGIDHGFGDARIGVVVYFQAYGRLDPLEVYLPEPYHDHVVGLYEQLDLERHVTSSHDASLRDWCGSAEHDLRNGISSVRFGSAAGGASRPAIELLETTLRQGQPVVYADVPIADPRAPALVDVLRGNGFCFGALLPGTTASEVIRMQRVDGASIAPGAIVTASPTGRALLDWIVQDHDHLAPHGQ